MVNSRFKFTPGQARLTDNGLKCSNSNFMMVWNRNRYGAVGKLLLHYDMAPALTDFEEAMP